MENRGEGTDNRTHLALNAYNRKTASEERRGELSRRLPAGEDVAERVRFGPRHLIALRPLEALHHLVPVQTWQG